MNFAASLGCTAVGLRPPSVAPQTRLKPTTETRQRSTYKKAKAVQTNGATSLACNEAFAQPPTIHNLQSPKPPTDVGGASARAYIIQNANIQNGRMRSLDGWI